MKSSQFLRGIGLTLVLTSWVTGQTVSNPDTTVATKSSLPHVMVEGLLWRPSGLDLSIVAPTSPTADPAIANFTGASQGLQYGFGPGYRAAVDWGTLTVDWLDLTSNSDFSASCSPGTSSCFMPLQEFPNSLRHAVDLAQASSQARLQLLDAGVRFSVLGHSSESQSALYWHLGIRYAKLWNNVQILYVHNGGSPSFMQRGEHTIDNMYGPRTALEGTCRFARRLSAQGLLGVSVLSGHSHHDNTIVTGPGTDQFGVFQNLSINQTGTIENVIVPVLELTGKVTYSPAQSLDVWIGYDFINFSDVLVKQNFTGNTDTQATDVRHSVSFQGPRAGLSWKFGRN